MVVSEKFIGDFLKQNQDNTLGATDHRNYNADGNAFNVGETFSGVPFKEGVKLAEEIKNILPAGNLATQAIRWILAPLPSPQLYPALTGPVRYSLT